MKTTVDNLRNVFDNKEFQFTTVPPKHNEASPTVTSLGVIVASVLLLYGITGVVRSLQSDRLRDYVQDWTSARNYWAGKPIYMDFNESVALHLDPASYGKIPIPQGFINPHPPTSVLLALPFAKLPYHKAYLAWSLASLAAFGASVWLLLSQRCLGYSRLDALTGVTALIISYPFRMHMYQGQLTLILLLLLAVWWVAQREGRFALSGLMVGIATAIKVFPGFLFLYFVVRRQWRAFFTGVAALVILSVITGAILGFNVFQVYLNGVINDTAAIHDMWLNASLTGFWSKLFDAKSGHVIPLWQNAGLARFLIVFSFGLLLLALRWKTLTAKSKVDDDHIYGLWIIATLLASPVTWDHYFLLLTVPLAVMWKYLPPSLFNRFFMAGVIAILGSIQYRTIFEAIVPGDGEFAGAGKLASVALPIHTLTVLSYPFYTLLALFLFALFSKPAARLEAA
jgi:hypothetical protein